MFAGLTNTMEKKIIPYNPKLVDLAKKLRNNSTTSEILLWEKLRKKQMMGYDFDRQKPIHNYIVDFYCAEFMMAIEIDGKSHEYKYQIDLEREKVLEKLGVNIIRFNDEEVKENIDQVLSELRWFIKQQES